MTNQKVTIYHNPRCSKSRETLALLQQRGIEVEIIEYLKTPPTTKELQTLVGKLGLPAKNLVRTKEDAFKELTLDLDNEKAVITALTKHPVLLERPIVVTAQRAAIGRPPENVLKIL